VAAPDVDDALAHPCVFYSGTTDASVPDGTKLGISVKATWEEGDVGGRLLTGHEYDGLGIGRIRGTEAHHLRIFFRSLDAAAFALAFYNTFTDGALKGRRPSLAEAGTLGARTVLLAAPVWAGRPGLIFYAASPVGHPVRHHLAEWPRELVWEVLFTAEPDPTTGQYVEWSTLANMTDP